MKKKITYTREQKFAHSSYGLGVAEVGQPIPKLGKIFTKYVPRTMPVYEKNISSDTSCGMSQTLPNFFM